MMSRYSFRLNKRLQCRRFGWFLWAAVRGLSLGASILTVDALLASPVLAVQSHGGAEGLVSHQIGHALFVVGLVCLVVRISFMEAHGKGWTEFKAFLWLLILWNVTTFTGHMMDEIVSPEKFVKANGATLAFVVENFADAVFYLTRLDHVLLVPSFVFLLLALRKWRTP